MHRHDTYLPKEQIEIMSFLTFSGKKSGKKEIYVSSIPDSQGYSFSLWPLKGGYSQKDILETAHSISLYRSMALTQQGLSPASCDMTHEKALMRYGNKKA